jgi:GDP-L-fucose synthase
MKVLVTGGQGLVGKSLQKVSQTVNHINFIFLSRKDCDLRNKDDVFQCFKKHSPDVVVHLASHVGGVYDNMNNNYTYLIDNIAINTNVVEACKEFAVSKLINILSTCIFPNDNVTYPLTSAQLHNGLPHYSNIGYAYSKRILHVASSILAEEMKGDLCVVNLIPTNLYGENDNYNIDAAHVIPALVHKTYQAMKSNSSLYVKGSGTAVRQFLYADDLSRVIVKFLEMPITKNNVSCIVSPPSSHEISIRLLVTYITNMFNFTGGIVYERLESDGQHKKTTSDSELLQYMPDFEFTNFEDGLESTIDYFIKHYDELRK